MSPAHIPQCAGAISMKLWEGERNIRTKKKNFLNVCFQVFLNVRSSLPKTLKIDL
jgi:hypothetical protein